MADAGGEQGDMNRLSKNIMPHILNMYNCRAKAADFEIYAPNATFEDPLMRAHGVKQIKSAFYSIPKVFSVGKLEKYTVQEVETTPGNGEISIDNVQNYKIFGRQIDMVSLIKLQVENGKVIKHVDMWDKKPFSSPETAKFAFVGSMAQGLRRCNMMFTHMLMGCGKDPA